MIRGLALSIWEIKRIIRSRVVIALLAGVPIILGVASSRSNGGMRAYCEMLALCVIFGWLLLYMRSLSDRSTGFADGIESTPAAGTSVYVSKIVLGFVVTVIETSLFCAAARM